MNRKKKLRLIQTSLLIFGSFVIFFTYFNKDKISKELIVSKEDQKKIENQLAKQEVDGDIFFNIEYSGLDLAGNRYILKSEEAYNNKSNQKIVNMKTVNAVFYFKDGTILTVLSDTGVYNNESLDMIFNGNVKAAYDGSELFAEKAEYNNSESFLTISEKVIVKDPRGTINADKLFFDIKKQKLNIASFDNKKINANINLK
jgi:LPS export ABC transporter protein LptC|tara:strand:+ start:40 stop:642 length:603 start_codon:yes stop_codon:yes gene_type:complete